MRDTRTNIMYIYNNVYPYIYTYRCIYTDLCIDQLLRTPIPSRSSCLIQVLSQGSLCIINRHVFTPGCCSKNKKHRNVRKYKMFVMSFLKPKYFIFKSYEHVLKLFQC